MEPKRHAPIAAIAITCLSTLAVAAQPPDPPDHPPGPPAFGMGPGAMPFPEGPGGPDERRVEGAPYRAQVGSEHVQTLADGSRIVRRTSGSVARDAAGRTRREQVIERPGGESRRIVFIDDPEANARYVLFPDRKVVHELARRPGGVPAREPGAFARHGAGVRRQLASKTESLGRQAIGGVDAEGTRETVTIPSGAVGNEKALETVSERWYSPDLQVVVLGRRHDPLHGDSTYALTEIVRGEPEAALFEVPAGYTFEEPAFERAVRPGARR